MSLPLRLDHARCTLVCTVRRLRTACLGLLVLVGSAASAQSLVAAASDLQFALAQVATQFERASGHKLRLVFGSSGKLYTQIVQGAPFELFLSADEDFAFKLARAGLAQGDGRLYAQGRIGLFVPTGSPVQADGTLKDLAAAVADGRLQKLAIANPAHAPYGQRAQEALRHAGLWAAVAPKLVLGENIAQAAQFASSGSAQAVIIAQSLALAPALAQNGRFALIDAAWHQPLRQRMVLLKNASPAARAFYDYLGTAQVQALLQSYGLAPP